MEIKIKKGVRQRLIIVGIFSIFLILIFSFISAQTQLFFEDWEVGNFDNWTNTGWTIESSPAIGSNSVGCLGKQSCDISSTISVDTSSVGTVNVSFSYYDIGCEAGDVIWYWNNSDGIWISMGNIDGGTLSGDNDWYTYSVQSNDLQYKHIGFAIRFWTDLAPNEDYLIDNINISYSEAPEDSCSPTTPLSANYVYECSDNCVISSNVDAGGYNITLNGTGTFTVNANISNVDEMIKSNSCTMIKLNSAEIS